MKIQLNWKVMIVLVLGAVVAVSAWRYESVANTLVKALAPIISALGLG